MWTILLHKHSLRLYDDYKQQLCLMINIPIKYDCDNLYRKET